MAVFNSSGVSSSTVNAIVQGAASPVILNISLALANTEYSQVLPEETVRFRIMLRDNIAPADLKLAYILGDSGTTYISVPRYTFYSESDLTLAGPTTLYFQSNKPGQVAELVYWTS